MFRVVNSVGRSNVVWMNCVMPSFRTEVRIWRVGGLVGSGTESVFGVNVGIGPGFVNGMVSEGSENRSSYSRAVCSGLRSGWRIGEQQREQVLEERNLFGCERRLDIEKAKDESCEQGWSEEAEEVLGFSLLPGRYGCKEDREDGMNEGLKECEVAFSGMSLCAEEDLRSEDGRVGSNEAGSEVVVRSIRLGVKKQLRPRYRRSGYVNKVTKIMVSSGTGVRSNYRRGERHRMKLLMSVYEEVTMGSVM